MVVWRKFIWGNKIFIIKNASLLAMNLMITAKRLGLETYPLGGFNEESIKKEFNISNIDCSWQFDKRDESFSKSIWKKGLRVLQSIIELIY